MNGRLNIEIKVAEIKRGLRSMKEDLDKAVEQLKPNQAATLDNKGRAIPIPENARNIIYLDYRKATLLVDESKIKVAAEKILKKNPHISEVIIRTKNGAFRVPPAKNIKSLSNVPSGLARIDSVTRPTQSYAPVLLSFSNPLRNSNLHRGIDRNRSSTNKRYGSNKPIHCGISSRKFGK
jgi:hypothetical protein